MSWSNIFERKTLEMLDSEMKSENRLNRVLGPLSLTSLGIGAIIGAGIFALTGRVAATDAGPAVMLSFALAGLACVFAALCYAEFASLAPVAGSAYTYTYATLGEIFAWIIGWDLILEYSVACAVVAGHWTHYLASALDTIFGFKLPVSLMHGPFANVMIDDVRVQTYVNLPAVLIMGVLTFILVRGIRESVFTNTFLVVVKLVVVLVVIGLGAGFVEKGNWTSIPVDQRTPKDVNEYLMLNPEVQILVGDRSVPRSMNGKEFLASFPDIRQSLSEPQIHAIEKLTDGVKKWGMLGKLGINRFLDPIDDTVRSPFMPYGFSGIMFGASLVFFSYIGFDSISTHAEETVNPQRNVPIAIISALLICTLLYVLVSGVITGMEPYYSINQNAAVAEAFKLKAQQTGKTYLNSISGFIAVGALAGMTSVMLVQFLSQSRVFLAMARDGLLPKSMFGEVHKKFQTPHRSTVITGVAIMLAAGFVPLPLLEEMVSIGTLMAFVMVCFSVLILRITRPDVPRPFKCPMIFIIAPLGIFVNLALMSFLPVETWERLGIWLALGLVIYFVYGRKNSVLRKAHRTSPEATS